MAWYDDWFSTDSTPNADMSVADQYASYGQGKVGLDNTGLSESDFMESLGLAFAGDTPNWAPQWDDSWMGGITNTAAYAERQGFNEPRAINETSNEKGGTSGGIIGRISDFVDKNKGLSEMLAKGIASAATGNSNQQTAEINARSRLDELKLKHDLERQKSADVSASVSGLRAPGGIINRGVLKRADGTPVYQNGRIA